MLVWITKNKQSHYYGFWVIWCCGVILDRIRNGKIISVRCIWIRTTKYFRLKHRDKKLRNADHHFGSNVWYWSSKRGGRRARRIARFCSRVWRIKPLVYMWFPLARDHWLWRLVLKRIKTSRDDVIIACTLLTAFFMFGYVISFGIRPLHLNSLYGNIFEIESLILT